MNLQLPAALPGIARPAASRPPATARAGLPPLAVGWSYLLAGTLAVAVAYALAAWANTGQIPFHLFWLGVLLVTVPALLRLAHATASRRERVAILVALALFDALPKYLRSPSAPLFHDELAHWRQAETIGATGRLFVPNAIIPIIQFFPGLHALTAALRDLSGLSIVQVGTIVLVALHALALLGIFILGERLLGSARLAGIAAFIYSLNPSYMFFDTQFSYESLAIVLFIWTVVAVTSMLQATDRPIRAAWLVVGLIVAAACIVTHHVTTYILVALLLLVTAVTALRAWDGTDRRANLVLVTFFTLLVAAGAGVWLALVARGVMAYLGPSLVGGATGLVHLFDHRGHARTLFAMSTLPAYEHACAFLAPLVVAAGAAAGLGLLRRRTIASSMLPALVVLGLLYFPSLPLILTQSGSEGARRSWAFSYLGLALLIAPVIPWLLGRGAYISPRSTKARGRKRQHHASNRGAGWKPALPIGRPSSIRSRLWQAVLVFRSALVVMLRRSSIPAAIAALASVVMIGNVAMHVNETYRFPGPYVYGSDTRTLTPELLGAAGWFRATQGDGRRVVTDRYTGLAFAAFGRDWVARASSGFPVWQLYFQRRSPSSALLRQIEALGYRYLIVDRRMAQYLPRIGMYFTPTEPGAFTRTTPPPAAALSRYDAVPWATKIYGSDNLSIYRLDLDVDAWSTRPVARGGQP